MVPSSVSQFVISSALPWAWDRPEALGSGDRRRALSAFPRGSSLRCGRGRLGKKSNTNEAPGRSSFRSDTLLLQSHLLLLSGLKTAACSPQGSCGQRTTPTLLSLITDYLKVAATAVHYLYLERSFIFYSRSSSRERRIHTHGCLRKRNHSRERVERKGKDRQKLLPLLLILASLISSS